MPEHGKDSKLAEQSPQQSTQHNAPLITQSITEALVAVKRDIGAVGKGETNEAQGWRFRGIDATVNAVAPALIEHGIIVAPIATTVQYEQIPIGQKQHRHGHVVVTVTYRWTGPAGDHLDTTVIGEAMDAGDKAGAKAMSVAYRTCLLQTLSLPTDEVDPDQDVYDRNEPPSSTTSMASMDGVHPRTRQTVEAIDAAVRDQDRERLGQIRAAIPDTAMLTIADPASGETLGDYVAQAENSLTATASTASTASTGSVAGLNGWSG